MGTPFVAAFVLKLWYIDRMTFNYDQHRDRAGGGQPQTVSDRSSSSQGAPGEAG